VRTAPRPPAPFSKTNNECQIKFELLQIIVFRVRCGVCSVRALYQCDSALSFWNISQRQASCSIPRRMRELPALARPFSRRFAPLSSGDPVIPAYRATARRSRRFRQSNSLTRMSAVFDTDASYLCQHQHHGMRPSSGAASSLTTRVFSIARDCSRIKRSRARSRSSSAIVFGGMATPSGVCIWLSRSAA